jgi:Cell division protein
MSELQLIVGASALVGVVGVYGWSRWQEARVRRTSTTTAEVRDPLFEPQVEGTAIPHKGMVSSPLPVWREALAPSPLWECAAVMKGSVSGRQWRMASQNCDVGWRVRWIGRVEGDRWVCLDPEDDHCFTEIQGLLQLVSRAGRVTDAQLQIFAEVMQRVGMALGAMPVLPDLKAMAQRATELDEWSLQVDIVVGVNVNFSSIKPPLASRLLDCLVQEGIGLGEDGVCHANSAVDGIDRFTLIRQDGAPFIPLTLEHEPITGITLLLEVARTPDPVTTFREMFALAERLALLFQGQVVDDQGERLGVGQSQAIERQLARVVGLLEAQQISAGSPWARQLFS